MLAEISAKSVNVYTKEAMTTPENPPTTSSPKTCIEKTRAGRPCSNRPLVGEERCFSHSEGAEAVRERATQASAEARKKRVEARKQASEDALLSLTDRARRWAASNADAVIESLGKAALADGSSRAMAELWNRVEGKVVDSLSVNAGDPFTMDEAALHRWLTESPEPESAP